MCILAVATVGTQFSRDTLEDMFYANSDGAGWAYARNGLIYYSKGYTSVNKFIKAVQKLPLDVERMVHCRISTHGGVTRELTHPFPIVKNYADMEKLSGTLSSGYILAHNGILSNFKPDKSHSDTEELARCLANIKCDIMHEDMRDIINALVDGSRVAILNTRGEIKRYGSGWSYESGIWFSNTYFKYTSMRTRRYTAYGWDDYDDWDGYANTYVSTPKNTMPDIKTLEPLMMGEVIKSKITKTARINDCDGTYLLDAKTNKLYGHYKGALYTTDYEVCDYYGCAMCTYKCPFKESEVV